MREMRFSGLFAAAVFCLLGCGNKESNSVPISRESASDKPSSVKEAKTQFPRLTNENCVDFLTDFGESHPQNRVKVTTKWGDFIIELFDDTPLHRANFLYMIERGYYTPTQVVRVIDDFVVQGGNSDEEMAALQRSIIGKYQIPEEIASHHYHHKGAVAMSRSYEENPDKGSSAFDFYVVDGKMPTDAEFLDVKGKDNFSHTERQLQVYREMGGAIHLDGEHTVFGKVVGGLRTIEILSELETDESDWPKEKVEFHMEVVN